MSTNRQKFQITWPSKRHAMAPHDTLHLVDVENICGCPLPDQEAVSEALRSFQDVMAFGSRDHAILGASPLTAFYAKQAWSGAQVVQRRGKDGADLALLAECDVAFIAARYRRVVVASGDHIFAPLVRDLIAAGVHVVVTARSGSIAWALRLERPEIRHLPMEPSSVIKPHVNRPVFSNGDQGLGTTRKAG